MEKGNSMTVPELYVIVIMDGAADEAQAGLGGRTPLQAARKPNSDAVAREGRVGLAKTIPDEMSPPGSDIATFSIMGYDPRRYLTGRAPLEAASLDVPMDASDVAFRCNLITTDGTRVVDYSAGEIPTPEAHALIRTIDQKLSTKRYQFFPGISYRHIMMLREASPNVRTTPPHDIMGQAIEAHLPQGDNEARLRQLMYDSIEILEAHDVNKRRRDEGKPPANMIWLWGQGRPCQLPSFAVQRGVPGIAIAAVDLIRGTAKSAGLAAPVVPGATGAIETDFAAKGRLAVASLEQYPFVLVHVEAPDEAAHQGSAEKKVWAIEQIDEHVVGPVLARLRRTPGSRMLIVSDHYTKLSTRTHAREPVPFALWGAGRDRAEAWDEVNAAASGLFIEEGWRLADLLFG